MHLGQVLPPPRVIAVDGKSARGARLAEERAVHLLVTPQRERLAAATAEGPARRYVAGVERAGSGLIFSACDQVGC